MRVNIMAQSPARQVSRVPWRAPVFARISACKPNAIWREIASWEIEDGLTRRRIWDKREKIQNREGRRKEGKKGKKGKKEKKETKERREGKKEGKERKKE